MVSASSARVVAAEVATARPELPGIRGERGTVEAFADTWGALTGRHGDEVLEERLYRLSELYPPTGVPGAARIAADGDRGVLTDWLERFFVETFGHPRDDAAGTVFLDDAASRGDAVVLWELDGTPVSMALLRAAAAGVSRIGPVFTPQTHRGHGFGSAVTTAAAGSAIGDGVDDVVLFTDLSNPRSNAIYRDIGFEPVVDSVRIDFRTLD